MQTTMTETKVETPEKIRRMAEYVMDNWTQFKEMERVLTLYNDKIKDYMVENNIDKLKAEKGEFVKIDSSRNMLDRSLIEDIEKYYTRQKTVTIYKVPYN